MIKLLAPECKNYLLEHVQTLTDCREKDYFTLPYIYNNSNNNFILIN